QPWVYKLAIALDLVLRFMWSLKLSSHLHQMVELESGVFVLEALEIFRRWCWVFLRVEWEFIRSGRLSAAGLPHHQESGIYTPLEVDDDL
ncbi:EXS-domain-containing protein, partial [Violaceomyces palustris]